MISWDNQTDNNFAESCGNGDYPSYDHVISSLDPKDVIEAGDLISDEEETKKGLVLEATTEFIPRGEHEADEIVWTFLKVKWSDGQIEDIETDCMGYFIIEKGK